MAKSFITAILLVVALSAATLPGPKTFSTPEEARDALVKAASAGVDALRELFGPESVGLIRTGDAVQDKILLDKFNERTRQKIQIEPNQMNPDRAILLIGDDEWPFAVPLFRKNGSWSFDIKEGKAEIRYRIIGGNELDAIQVCLGFVEAQEIYSQTDWQGKGVMQYAGRILSSPGKKDGLYWPGDESPISEGVTKAFSEGYPGPTPLQPYHGYLYKMLHSQGPAAQGGAQDYLIRDLMIGGFALVAWPAEYGISGIRTFIVNQDGIVYEKDLGPNTGALAKAMKKFNPDASWQITP